MNFFDLARQFDNLNHRDIAEFVAREYGEIFITACEKTRAMPNPMPGWFADVRYELGRNMRVAAIKIVRSHTGLGLKEAKDAIDLFDGACKPHNAAQVSIDVANDMRTWAGQPEVKIDATTVQMPEPATSSPSLGETLKAKLDEMHPTLSPYDTDEKATKLEDDILKLLRQFRNDTGRVVTSVNVEILSLCGTKSLSDVSVAW